MSGSAFAGIENSEGGMSEVPSDRDPSIVVDYAVSSECLSNMCVSILGFIIAFLVSSVLLSSVWACFGRLVTKVDHTLTLWDAILLNVCLMILSCYFFVYNALCAEYEGLVREVLGHAKRYIRQTPQ